MHNYTCTRLERCRVHNLACLLVLHTRALCIGHMWRGNFFAIIPRAGYECEQCMTLCQGILIKNHSLAIVHEMSFSTICVVAFTIHLGLFAHATRVHRVACINLNDWDVRTMRDKV